MIYQVIGNSRRIEKDFLQIINRFNKEEQDTVWQILRTNPKGNMASHWTIKKVYKNIWQLDLPDGYRLKYTVFDKEHQALIRFIGNHDDAAAFL